MKAQGRSPTGPWIKQPDVKPFRTKPGSYFSATASPGHVIKHGDEYLMFFSASTDRPILRTLGIARTKDLDGPWAVDPEPIVPPQEQIENSSLYFEPANNTWFLFTNHIGLDGGEFTDAIWVYWTEDLNRWDATDKAVVLDGKNCNWSGKCVGLPSVVKHGNRLAIFYDAPGGDSTSHMKRDIGLAWLDLPLSPPPDATRTAAQESGNEVPIKRMRQVHEEVDLIQSSEPWDKQFAHKPWVLKHDGVVYHFYCAVGDQGRVIALATSKDLKDPSKRSNETH